MAVEYKPPPPLIRAAWTSLIEARMTEDEVEKKESKKKRVGG